MIKRSKDKIKIKQTGYKALMNAVKSYIYTRKAHEELAKDPSSDSDDYSDGMDDSDKDGDSDEEIWKAAIANPSDYGVQYKQANPKKPGKNPHARYEKYKHATRMDEVIELSHRDDIRHDARNGFLKIWRLRQPGLSPPGKVPRRQGSKRR